jgi:5-methylcytosine-specific restriction protein A
VARVCRFCTKPAVPGQSKCRDHIPKSSSWGQYAVQHPERAARYVGSRWRILRDEVLARDPECQIRGPGCSRVSTVADHRVPVAEGGSDLLENLQGACRPCHLRKTNVEGHRGNRRKANRDDPR